MKLKLFLLPIMFASLVNKAFTQNIGIGTDSPQAKLHVNGNFKLKNGIAVNSISTDSTFDPGSDSTLPTQRAIKRFLQKGSWLGPDTSERKLIFQQRKEDLNMDGEMGLALQGHFAYAINPLENILSTYDISDPKNII